MTRAHPRRAFWFWVVLLAGFALFALVAVSPKYAQNARLRHEEQALEVDIKRLKVEIVRLRKIEAAILEDPFYNEVIARKELRLARHGEKAIRVAPYRKSPPAKAQARESTFEFYLLELARHRGIQYFLMAVAFMMIASALVVFGESEKEPS